MTDQRETYAGAQWLDVARMHWPNQKLPISPIGALAADILGDAFLGLYHINAKILQKVDWSNPDYIEINLPRQHFATFDDGLLTVLVLLAHDRCVRIELSAKKANVMCLMFHPRQRDGSFSKRHPRLEKHIEDLRSVYGQPSC